MYDKTDPRSSLATAIPAVKAVDTEKPYGTASYVHFKDGPPQEQDALIRKWYGRGHNFLICYVEAKAGATIERATQPDEYVILSPQKALALRVESEHGSEDIPGFSVVVVPPGKSTIYVKSDGHFFVLYTSKSSDLLGSAVNSDAYRAPRHHVAPFAPWPDPADGPKIRCYSMDVKDEPGRFGRMWRNSTFMVNVFIEDKPRDIEKLSPHHHDDFEQCSLLAAGTMSHHLRWPWTTNMRNWLPDEHVDCHSPSMTVIPPPAIHTSNGTGAQPRMLIDVFCPPRIDFSMKAGWVLNANEYPMPTGR
jgi:hypothetical protein